MYNLYQYSPLFCYQFGLLVSMYIDATYSTIGRKKYFFCLSIYSYYSLSFKVGESVFCHLFCWEFSVYFEPLGTGEYLKL